MSRGPVVRAMHFRADAVDVPCGGALVSGLRLEPEPPRECLIKGNVNREGEHIYHTPGSRYYEKTKINKPGERWFCIEAEAEATRART